MRPVRYRTDTGHGARVVDVETAMLDGGRTLSDPLVVRSMRPFVRIAAASRWLPENPQSRMDLPSVQTNYATGAAELMLRYTGDLTMDF